MNRVKHGFFLAQQLTSSFTKREHIKQLDRNNSIQYKSSKNKHQDLVTQKKKRINCKNNFGRRKISVNQNFALNHVCLVNNIHMASEEHR